MKKYITQFLFVLMAAVSLFLAASQASAQGIFEQDAPSNRAVKLPEIDFDRNNPYLRDMLTLQKQISLLQKITEREKKISEIITSYHEIGLDIEFPAPNRDWCEQIPANLSCAYHYPNMYDDFDISILEEPFPEPEKAKKPGEEEEMPALPPQNPLHALDYIPMHVAEQSLQERELLKEMKMAWTRINCLGTKCSAVISPMKIMTDGNGEKEKRSVLEDVRYTINVGDTLPDGGIVDNISAQGVTVRDSAGSVTSLEAAPQ